MGLKIKNKIIDGDMLASLPEDYRYSQENDDVSVNITVE
jgi:hypothetical protein